jgi:hypothetical protein
MANASGTCSALVTFSPHPLEVLHPAKAPKLILDPKEKIERIRALGVDYVLILKFDRELSLLSGEDFIREILVKSLRGASRGFGPGMRLRSECHLPGRGTRSPRQQHLDSGTDSVRQNQHGQPPTRAFLRLAWPDRPRPRFRAEISLPHAEPSARRFSSPCQRRLCIASVLWRTKLPGSYQHRYPADRLRNRTGSRNAPASSKP